MVAILQEFNNAGSVEAVGWIQVYPDNMLDV